MNKPLDNYLFEAFNKILRPLIKISMRSGVRYEEFCRVVKGVYIESAIRDGIGLPGDQSASKIAMATGITRREIELHVIDSQNLPRTKPTIQAALSEILHRWHTESLFLGPYGIPLEVEFSASAGRSFSELVRQVDPSVDPSVLLEELLRSGAVVRSGEKHFKVVSRTFLVPEPMSQVMLEYFGNTVTDLMNTLEFNMDPARSSKRLQRSVYADRGLNKKQLAEFEAFAAAKAQEFMVEIDNWLGDTSAKATNPNEPVLDVGLSVFNYVRPVTEEPSLATLLEVSTD
jgi:hypothetical protein